MYKRPRSRDIPSQLFKWFLLGCVAVSAVVPIRLAISIHQTPHPQAIFVLGGDVDRMKFAAQFWHSHSDLTIWITDFPAYEVEHRQIFQQSGVPEDRVRFDGRATDTVTNFTSLANDFSQQKLRHFYLITSDYHMRRARAIATIVFGSRGIIVTPVSVPSQNQPSESLTRILRDCGRSFVWLVTGRTGAKLNTRIESR
ncbi:YdcF family protein [Phormidesmis sp. 146-33]